VLDIAKIESGQFSLDISEHAIAATESLAALWALSVNAHVASRQEGGQTFGSALRRMTRPRFLRSVAPSDLAKVDTIGPGEVGARKGIAI
jgi:hypothetical protein